MTADQLTVLGEICDDWSGDTDPKAIEAIRAARDLIASLPRTADGVPVTNGKTLYAWDREHGCVGWCTVQLYVGYPRDDENYKVEQCYSTESAALAAGKGV